MSFACANSKVIGVHLAPTTITSLKFSVFSTAQKGMLWDEICESVPTAELDEVC